MVRDLRRAIPLGLVAVLVLLGAVFAPTAASARPLAQAPASCPKPKPYPPAPNATVQSSTTTPNAGDTIEASGINYCPDEDVDLTIGGQHVGTAHTDANGSFDPPVVVPGPSGEKQLCGVGASGLSTDQDCLTLTVGGNGGSNAAGGGGSGNNGGTAFTGTQVALLLLIALALLGGGIAFSTAGRRKQSARV